MCPETLDLVQPSVLTGKTLKVTAANILQPEGKVPFYPDMKGRKVPLSSQAVIFGKCRKTCMRLFPCLLT